jgi:arsenate reductase
MTATQNDKTYNVLFLCTGNSARSIMAEALLNSMGKGRFNAYSAGSHPGGTVNPLAIEQIKPTGYPLDKLRSKSWDEFATPDAPKMDFIITVCDNAAGEICPIWPGQPISAHWGFEDPAAAIGTEAQKRAVFSKIARQITTRVNIFNSLPFQTLENTAIKREMDAIGNSAI